MMKQRCTSPVMIGVVALAAVLLSGCATHVVLPNKTFVRFGPDYTTAMPAVDHVGLFVDGAIVYNGFGSPFWDIADSQAAINNLTQESQTDLKTKGYDVTYAEAPFVGGIFNPASPGQVATGRDATPASMTPPFQTADYLNADPDYRNALQTVSQKTFLALGNAGRFPTESLQSDPAVKTALGVIADKRHIQYLMVVQGKGTIVSSAKQVGQAVGTGLLTTVLTLGLVTVTSHNISVLDSYAGLIDLRTAEVLWSNSLRLSNFNAADTGDYKSAQWAHNVLYWLPPRGSLEPPPVAK